MLPIYRSDMLQKWLHHLHIPDRWDGMGLAGFLAPWHWHKVVNDAVEQIRGSHTALSNSAGDGEPVGERVLLMRTQLDVYSRSSTRTILGGIPMEWRMCHRQSRSTESNAALKDQWRKDTHTRSFRNSRAFSASNRMAEMVRAWSLPDGVCGDDAWRGSLGWWRPWQMFCQVLRGAWCRGG